MAFTATVTGMCDTLDSCCPNDFLYLCCYPCGRAPQTLESWTSICECDSSGIVLGPPCPCCSSETFTPPCDPSETVTRTGLENVTIDNLRKMNIPILKTTDIPDTDVSVCPSGCPNCSEYFGPCCPCPKDLTEYQAEGIAGIAKNTRQWRIIETSHCWQYAHGCHIPDGTLTGLPSSWIASKCYCYDGTMELQIGCDSGSGMEWPVCNPCLGGPDCGMSFRLAEDNPGLYFTAAIIGIKK